jgi:heme-degrading monooxygenase HmoA
MAGYVSVIRFDEGIIPLPNGVAPTTDGLIGSSLWQNGERESQKILLIHFRDEASAQEHVRQIVPRLLDLPADQFVSPDGISGVLVNEYTGTHFEDSINGSYMFMGNILANPGFGSDIQSKISETATAVRTLPGYVGHAHGAHVSNSDEVWFFAFWETVPTFTLPPDLAATSGIYQRIN